MERLECKHRRPEHHGKYDWCPLCGSVRWRGARRWRQPYAIRGQNYELVRKKILRCKNHHPTEDGGFYTCLRTIGHHGPHKAGPKVWKR